MDPNVLSAENYYNEVFSTSSPKKEQDVRNQWLGELLADRSAGKQSARSLPGARKAGRAPKKEKSQSTSPDESNGARQRGRPRLDTRDETAAERRRTQIRLAQRAYRQRKETTISGLNKRVTELEQTIGKMNKAFLDFNDKAIASGIGSWEPHLAQDLKSTMESFIDSARYLEQTSDDEGNETVPNLSARVFEEKAANSDTPAMISMDPPENQALTSEDAAIAALLGWTSNSPVVDESNIQNSPTEIEPALGARNHSSDWLTAEPLVQYRVEMPSSDIGLEVLPPALPESPPLPMSYSFQETSFARRLLRTALEGAYRVLTNPNTRSEDLLHFCKDTFTWTNRKHCIAWLEKALSKTARENLEYWGAPQLHIGGAGLHYPRTGFDTGTGPPPGWAADAPMGPLPFIVPEPLLDGCLSSVHDGESVDLSGEWFDSNDVEQYLQTKGLFLDGRSSYVKLDVDGAVDQPCEAHVPVTGSPTESSRDSNGYPPSPCMQDPILLDGPLFEENALFWDEEMLIRPGFEELDAGSLLDTSGFCHPKEASKPEVFGSVPPPLLMSSYRSMIQRYVDVEKFILAIMQSAVCLGRTPGFRRSAIDAALEAAILIQY